MIDVVTIIETVIDNEIINTKEELFDKIKQAESYYHVLEILKNTTHIPISKAERMLLMKLANARLKELQQKRSVGNTTLDPYESKFYLKRNG